jgi:hypothetical protein
MLTFLYNYSNFSIILISIVFLFSVLISLHFIARQIPVLRPRQETFDFAMRMQIPVFSMCGLLLAFSLVNVQGNLRRVDGLVATEASQINNLDRLLTRFGDPQTEAVRSSLHAYVRSIIHDEWPAMERGGGSEQTRLVFQNVSRDITALVAQPGRQMQMFADILKKGDEIAESREARIETAEVALRDEYWYAVGLIIFILTSLMSLVEMNAFRIYAMGLQLSSLAVILALVFITDHPYLGETSVKPDALQKVLNVMEARKL